MKKIAFLLVFQCVALSAFGQQTGIEFFKGTFAEALEKASKENKLVFMDAFAEWCGPCKRMAATAFVDAKVGQYFNANFINVKMDMEKGEGPALQRKYDVGAYPTLLFLNGKGNVVHTNVGGLNAEQLLSSAKLASMKVDDLKDLEKSYNEGKRDPEFIASYVRALNRADKPSLKVVNDFLLKADKAQPSTLKVIYEGTTQADSKVFDLLVQNRAKLGEVYTPALVDEKMKAAIEKTLQNAVQFKSAPLHKEAKDKMKLYFPQNAENFGLTADLKFYKATQDAGNYVKTTDKFAKLEAKNDARKLYTLAKGMIDDFPYDKTVLTSAEKHFKKAVDNGGICEYAYWYAQTLMRLGKKEEALKNAEKALKIAEETAPNYIPAAQELINQIKTK